MPLVTSALRAVGLRTGCDACLLLSSMHTNRGRGDIECSLAFRTARTAGAGEPRDGRSSSKRPWTEAVPA